MKVTHPGLEGRATKVNHRGLEGGATGVDHPGLEGRATNCHLPSSTRSRDRLGADAASRPSM
jgi:hypothetical protein